jgi:1-acyl-sn-glycerol-3-phosphate acyltransferase
MTHALPRTQPRPQPEHWWQSAAAGFARDVAQRAVLFPAVGLLCSEFEVEGREQVEELDGPAIFVANHSSHFDTFLVLRALPAAVRHRVTVAAAADYFYTNPLKGSAVSMALNTFPFDRERGAGSLELARKAIDDGWSLLIFPEGTRSRDGEIGMFRKGVGALATSLPVPVVPVHLDGAHRLMAKGRSLPRRTAVGVRFGEPVAYAPGNDAIVVANDLQRRVAALETADR